MISCQELRRFPVLSKARRTQRDETPEDNVGAMWTSQHGHADFFEFIGCEKSKSRAPMVAFRVLGSIERW